MCPIRLQSASISVYGMNARKKEFAMNRNDAPPVGLIPTRVFGKTGVEVTVTGLGGEGVLRTYGQEDDARRVIGEAFTQGITYFDCARAYAGSEKYYGLVVAQEV